MILTGATLPLGWLLLSFQPEFHPASSRASSASGDSSLWGEWLSTVRVRSWQVVAVPSHLWLSLPAVLPLVVVLAVLRGVSEAWSAALASGSSSGAPSTMSCGAFLLDSDVWVCAVLVRRPPGTLTSILPGECPCIWSPAGPVSTFGQLVVVGRLAGWAWFRPLPSVLLHVALVLLA